MNAKEIIETWINEIAVAESYEKWIIATVYEDVSFPQGMLLTLIYKDESLLAFQSSPRLEVVLSRAEQEMEWFIMLRATSPLFLLEQWEAQINAIRKLNDMLNEKPHE